MWSQIQCNLASSPFALTEQTAEGMNCLTISYVTIQISSREERIMNVKGKDRRQTTTQDKPLDWQSTCTLSEAGDNYQGVHLKVIRGRCVLMSVKFRWLKRCNEWRPLQLYAESKIFSLREYMVKMQSQSYRHIAYTIYGFTYRQCTIECLLYLQQADGNRQSNTSGAQRSFSLRYRPGVSLKLPQ